VDAVTADFNRAKHQTGEGKPIYVRTVAMGSGEMMTEILEGRLQAHLASPASAAFIELGDAESLARTGKPLVGDTENLVLSPVVIAMWKPMAEALGWGKEDKEGGVGWSDILDMATSAEGWAKYDYPQWGKFKFGHTHPEYSNSGIISLFAEVYAGAGKVSDLTLEDVERPEVGAFLETIEKSVVHYGSSTGFFGRKMFAGGPQYLSAAVLYENMVIESYDSDHALPFPVVAVYPKEGTFWSDHPVGIVQRDWVRDEHREAAAKYIEFLVDKPQQERALEFGFRPADVTIPLSAPIDGAHGVDPAQPKTTLEVPSATVAKAIIELWKQRKKHANVVLVLDVSGSMQGEKIAAAKVGGGELIAMLGDEDVLSLLPFNDQRTWAGQGLRMADNRQKASDTVASYFADGGTALYDAVIEAQRYLVDNPTADMITAVVVLSDGEDTNSTSSLSQLIDQVRTDNETRTTRVFTIGYGKDASEQVLSQLADATGAKFYRGTPENIREVFKEISTFF
jgi:Ca-activated chloride channel family protein